MNQSVMSGIIKSVIGRNKIPMIEILPLLAAYSNRSGFIQEIADMVKREEIVWEIGPKGLPLYSLPQTEETPKTETIDPKSLSFGYDPEFLETIFSRIQDPEDWKNPIFIVVPGELVSVVTAAIKFYTATVPTVGLKVDTMEYIIQSEGYRMGPAGDH
jgi:hypothetical protein